MDEVYVLAGHSTLSTDEQIAQLDGGLPLRLQSEDAQLARAIAASLGESVPSSAAGPPAAESRPAPERVVPLPTPPPPRDVDRGGVSTAAAPPSSQQRGLRMSFAASKNMVFGIVFLRAFFSCQL